jgi:8-oxo-dGTP diphosphatase
MKKLNVILLFNKDESKVLMCLREKDPYKGLFNLVGGKLEEGETELEGAYRELEEETGITKDDVVLSNLMNFQYIKSNFELEVFSGRLNKDVELVEEINKLYWIDSNENFYDKAKFAGEGNIGVMYETYQLNKDKE